MAARCTDGIGIDAAAATDDHPSQFRINVLQDLLSGLERFASC